ncbi:MAG TPA: hypothetical protein ENK52_02915 [Saprospiraceae bacterium]|nr:hypothetical protein [Saprospiraceae bacterium]
MKNNLLFYTLISFFLFFLSCREEEFVPDTFGAVFGQVLEDGTNSAIQNATVTTNPPTNILQTDQLGRFALENIKTGNYTLRVEKTGYVTKVDNISVLADGDINVVIKLITDSLANTAPTAPSQPIPEDETKELATSVHLSWHSMDADGDDLTYDLRLFNADQTEITTIAEGLTDTTYELTELNYGSIYFWQVIVNDGKAAPVNGDLWNFETVAFPNHRFLFARMENGKYDIYSSDEEGNSIQLTNNSSNNWRPRMSPDRDKIAFLSNVGLETHLYMMDRNGDNVQQISSIAVSGSDIFDLDFSWSPDGEKLLYMNGNKLYTVNRDGTGTQLFSEAPNGFVYAECDWTIVGNKVIARMVADNLYNSIIYLYESDGTFVQPLLSDIPGSTEGAMFSIDGTQMLYTQDVSGYEVPDGRQLDARIFIRNLSASVPSDISSEKTPGTNDLDPRFSPDGAWVIFMNTNNDGISPKNIYKMNLDGTNRVLLFENAEMPDWR